MTAVLADRLSALPTPLTPLIGREREVAAITRLVHDPAVRLVTLTGPGGAGKTRLALAVVAETASSFADGARLVSLAAVNDPQRVLATISERLGVREAADRSMLEQLIAALRRQEVLLLLDTFEHVLPAAPTLIHLLNSCPLLTLLVTSRVVLHLSGAHDYPVAPLDVLDPARAPAFEAIAGNSAVRLFVDRARAARHDFELTSDNAQAVLSICARLDGLPLSIVLAAARSRHLPPLALLARLDYRLTLLTGGARDLPERQQTLRATIAWSYALLSPAEQATFQRLAVFPGGCTLDAAEFVLGDPALDPAIPDVLDSLSTLVDNSLLYVTVDPDGSARYRTLDTLREFAGDVLEDAERARVLTRLGDWLLALLAAAHDQVLGPRQGEWLRRIELEMVNIRGVFAWATAVSDNPLGALIASGLGRYWYIAGQANEGLAWFDRVVAAGVRLATRERMLLLGARGYVEWVRGDYVFAQLHAAESLALAQANAELAWVGDMFFMLGVILEDTGEYAAAERHLLRAKDAFRADGRTWWVGYTLNALGVVAFERGDIQQARGLFEEALLVQRTAGNSTGAGYPLINLAKIARADGKFDEAERLYVESLRVRVEQDDTLGIAGGLRGLASIALARDDLGRAACFYGAAERLTDASGARLPAPAHAKYLNVIAGLRAQMDDSAFVAHWTAGRSMTRAEALNLALAPEASDTALPTTLPAGEVGGLSRREVDVLRLLAAGRSNRDIATTLFISQRTVETHVARILAKLSVESRSAAAVWAVRQGMN